MRPLRFAAVLLLAPLVTLAQQPQKYQAPATPAAPTRPEECQRLRDEWSALRQKISTEHQACLDANTGAGSNPNKAGVKNPCSRAACESLHQLLYGEQWTKAERDATTWCDGRVKAYQDASRRLREAQQPATPAPVVPLRPDPRADAERALRDSQDRAARMQQAIDDLRRSLVQQDQIAQQGVNDANAAAIIGGVATPVSGAADIAMGTLGAAVTPTLAKGYSATTAAIDLATAGDPLTAAGAGARLAGAGAAGNAIDTAKAAYDGEAGDALGSGLSGLGEVADVNKLKGTGAVLGIAGTVVSGLAKIGKTMERVRDSLGLADDIRAMSESNKRAIESRLALLEQKMTYSRETSLRLLHAYGESPVVKTFDNWGTRWGQRADGSLIDLGSGQIWDRDPRTGALRSR